MCIRDRNKGTLGSAVNLNTPLSSATFPAGHILQQKIMTSSNYVSNATTSFNGIQDLTIENVKSGSRIIIQAAVCHLLENGGQGAFRIKRASDNGVLGHGQHASNGNGGWRQPMPTIIVEDTSPSTGTNTYNLEMRSSQSSCSLYYNYFHNTHEGARSFFLLTEMTQ